MGKEYLVLKVKVKDEDDPTNNTKWEVVKNDEFGPIADMDLERTWNVIKIPEVTSPPTGRTRHKEAAIRISKTEATQHNLFAKSSEEENTNKKIKPSEINKKIYKKKTTQKTQIQEKMIQKDEELKMTPLEKFLRRKDAANTW